MTDETQHDVPEDAQDDAVQEEVNPLAEIMKNVEERNRTGQKVGRPKKLGPGDFKYVNMDLLPRDKPDFERWVAENGEKNWLMMDEMIQDGYKFSFGFDERNETLVLNVTCMNENSPNYTGIMPSRSEYTEEALNIFLFKHHHICRGEWPIATEVDGKKWG